MKPIGVIFEICDKNYKIFILFFNIYILIASYFDLLNISTQRKNIT
jgi:hypothetical protein